MKRRAFIPAVMCVVSLLCIFIVIPTQTKSLNVPGDLEPSVFPCAAMSVIALLNGVMFWREWRKGEALEPCQLSAGDLKCLLVIILGLSLYLFLVKQVGYYTVTAIAMIGMLRKYDCMRWRWCIAGTAAYLLLCYLLFEVGLRITLPGGIFI